MNDAPCSMTAQRPQLSLLEKAITLASWGLAGAIFLTIGWFALEPDDPLGAVSLLMRHGAIMMLLQAGALAAAAAAVVTAMAGRSLAEVGTFAVAVGLAAVSLRGGTAGVLLIHYVETSPSFERILALNLALESIAWFAVIAVAIAVSACVARWCFAKDHCGEEPPDDPRGIAVRTMAGGDAPGVGVRFLGASPQQQTLLTDGIKHILVATATGLLTMSVLSAGLSTRSVQHGQACFMVAASVCIACYVAYRFVPVRSPLWSILAVPLIALVGYLWASVRPNEVGLPPSFPPSHFLRILPIQFISVGTAAAVMMFWYLYDPEHHADTRRSPQPAKPSTRRGA